MNKLIAAIEALPKGLGVFLSENGSYTQFSDLTTDDLKALVAQLKQLQKAEMENTGVTEYRKSEEPFI